MDAHPLPSVADPERTAFAPPPLPSLTGSYDADTKQLTAWYRESRENVRQQFLATTDAAHVRTQLSDMTDLLLEQLYRLVAEPHTRLSVIAVGGYGRQDLFPYSDIDVLFLYDGDAAAFEETVRRFLYPLWDLGLTIGHALRTIDQTLAACADHTITTALLDMRYVAGRRGLFADAVAAFYQYRKASGDFAFVRAKLEERTLRHKKWGDSRYLLEPNVKDGKGGLRDLHTLYWLASYCYDIQGVRELIKLRMFTPKEYRDFKRAEEFLSIIRVHLHYLNGRGDERLTFSTQCQIARALGYRESETNRAVERFMKRYFQTANIVSQLTRLFCAMLEEDKKRAPKHTAALLAMESAAVAPFVLDGERLNVPEETIFKHYPLLMMDLFKVAEERRLDIHPHALQLVSRNLSQVNKQFRHAPEANQAFIDILISPNHAEQTLRHMSEVGLLGRFLPDFGRILGQMQFDMYHIYTVDEHILRVIGILHDIRRGRFAQEMPVATDVMPQIHSPKVLFVAAFTHDIAKGRGGQHAEKGGEIAYRLALRFGLSQAGAATVRTLVLHQELLTTMAFKRDLGDPETYRYLAQEVQSLETFRLLFLLTVADVRAVGPNVWNGWKGRLLRDLYRNGEHFLQTGTLPNPVDSDALRQALVHLLPRWDIEAIDAYLQEGERNFLASRDAESHAVVAQLWQHCLKENKPVAVHSSPHAFHAVTELTVVARDRYGLLADVAGALSEAGANIVGARIATLKSGWAVQSWQVQDFAKQALTEEALLARVIAKVEQAAGTPSPALPCRAWPQRLRPLAVRTDVFINNEDSTAHTIIEIAALDRIGLLSVICRALQQEGINIVSAHISTYGEKAVDVFYVKDRYGLKLAHQERIEALRKRLIDATETIP